MFAAIFRPKMNVEVEPIESIEDEIARYSASLEQKRLVAIEKMGTKWIMHKDNYIQKKDVAENSLGFRTA